MVDEVGTWHWESFPLGPSDRLRPGQAQLYSLPPHLFCLSLLPFTPPSQRNGPETRVALRELYVHIFGVGLPDSQGEGGLFLTGWVPFSQESE